MKTKNKLISKTIVMLDTPQDIDTAGAQLGVKTEQLLTPLTRRKNRHADRMFAIDNGAYAGFKEKPFLSLLDREFENRDRCRFVTVPDVWANALRTCEIFDQWFARLSHWKLAFACQDGQDKLPIHWDLIDAIFVGGSNQWQHSRGLRDIIKTAKILNKWVHIGRVNTADRFQYFPILASIPLTGRESRVMTKCV